jgi:hypothetical protein
MRVMAAPVIAPGAIAPLALPSMPHIFTRCALGATLRRPVQFTLCQPVVRDFCQKAMRSNVTKGGGPNLSEVAIVLVML